MNCLSIRLTLAAGCMLWLGACGGGGEEPPADTPPPTPQPPVTLLGNPLKLWELHAIGVRDQYTLLDRTHGGVTTAVNESRTTGGLIYVPPGRDASADAAVFSTEDGKTYWTDAEAPHGDFGLQQTGSFGSAAVLNQFFSFRKDADNSTLRLIVSEAEIELHDFNRADVLAPVCPWEPQGASGGDHEDCFDFLSGRWGLTVFVTKMTKRADGSSSGSPIIVYNGSSQIRGYLGHWHPRDGVVSFSDRWDDARTRTLWQSITRPLFPPNSFNYEIDAARATIKMSLRQDVVVPIDLSGIDTGEEFWLDVFVHSTAHNRRGGESFASARLRDPVSASPVTFETSGLTSLEVPAQPPTLEEPAPPVCVAPAGGDYPATGGAVQFAEANYRMPEFDLPYDTVMVERTGGSSGVQVVRVQSAGGTAIAGTHFQPLDQVIVFGDGDETPRAVSFDTLNDNAASGDRTVSLVLTAESNCGRVGALGTTTVTIIDVDFVPGGGGGPPVPPALRLGGTVVGLVGTGLVIEESNSASSLSIAGNGAFQFDRDFAAGTAYEVRITSQPRNPAQTCAVTNGAGNFSGGTISDVGITCLAPPVSGLDPSFGVGGRAAGGPGGNLKALVQVDGGRLVGATSTLLARFLEDGTLDTTFGSGGQVSNVFGNASSPEIFDIVLQPDGKLVVVGAASPAGSTGLGTDFAVARFLSNGARDDTFNGGNTVFVDFIAAPDRATRVLLQPDGRILVIGLATTVYTPSTDDADFAVVRLESDGTFDTGFGTGGRATADLEKLDFGYAAGLQTDGRIVVGGRVSVDRSGDSDSGFARFNPDGTLDSTFGQAGTAVFELSPGTDEVVDLALQPDGKIVAAVTAGNGAHFEFGVLRLLGDGSRDATFGANGWASTSVGPGHDTAAALALQADGAIVVAGTALTTEARDYSDFGLARFTSSGAPDPGFGTAGVMMVDFFDLRDGAADVLIDEAGRIVSCGLALESAFLTRSALIRVNP